MHSRRWGHRWECICKSQGMVGNGDKADGDEMGWGQEPRELSGMGIVYCSQADSSLI